MIADVYLLKAKDFATRD